MKKTTLIYALALSGALTACGDASNSGPNIPNLCQDLNLTNCNDLPNDAPEKIIEVQAHVTNTLLPISEDFNATNAVNFFSKEYKALASNNPDDLDGAFYFSTSGLDSGRMAIEDGRLTIGNARFTIGQTKPNGANKEGSTSGDNVNVWGELDLKEPWKLSFCVVNKSEETKSENNQLLQIFVDNNTSNAVASIHKKSSLIESPNIVKLFEPGQRVTLTVPGTLEIGGQLIGNIGVNPGTHGSFIQLRVPSGASLTMSDLWLGYQSDTSTEPANTTCMAGERVASWNKAPPPATPLAPTIEATDGQLKVSWEAAPRAVTYNIAYNTVNSVDGATIVSTVNPASSTVIVTDYTLTGLTNGTPYYVFIQSQNVSDSSDTGVVQKSEYSPSASGTPAAATVAPTAPTGLVLTTKDSKIVANWMAVNGASTYSVAYNTTDDVTSAIEINDITDVTYTLPSLVNNVTYYVFVKAVNSAGESAYSPSQSATPTAAIAVTKLPLTLNFNVEKDVLLGTGGTAPAQTLTQTTAEGAKIPLIFATGSGSKIAPDSAAGTLSFAGARFTIGHIPIPQVADPSKYVETTSDDTEASGDLDLSGDYRIKFTVVQDGDAGVLQVYVDNNSTSDAKSMHGKPSRVFSKNLLDIAAGEEIVLEMTGVTHVGTETSFIQFRTDSNSEAAGGVVIKDVVIEPILSVTSLPFMLNLNVTKDELFGTSDATPAQTTVQMIGNQTLPMCAILGGDSTMKVDGSAGTATLIGSRFSIGNLTPAIKTVATDTASAGDLDLSGDYTISFTVISDGDLGKIQVYVDNNTSSSGDSMHGKLSKVYEESLINLAANQEVVIDMSGDLHVGTGTSFIQIRTDGASGPDGAVISNVVIAPKIVE